MIDRIFRLLNNKLLFKSPAKTKIEFDIPILINKNIDEIRVAIGKSDDRYFEPLKSEIAKWDSWDNCYISENYEFRLDIRFHPKTRQVIEFIFRKDGGDLFDMEELLLAGNLKSESDTYKIERPANKYGVFDYIKIYPNE